MRQNFNLNQLNQDDKSFLNDNGYNLSYIAVRYLYETNSLDKFINIISNHDILIEIGSSVLKDACSYYGINNKLIQKKYEKCSILSTIKTNLNNYAII